MPPSMCVPSLIPWTRALHISSVPMSLMIVSPVTLYGSNPLYSGSSHMIPPLPKDRQLTVLLPFPFGKSQLPLILLRAILPPSRKLVHSTPVARHHSRRCQAMSPAPRLTDVRIMVSNSIWRVQTSLWLLGKMLRIYNCLRPSCKPRKQVPVV
jgi:hypothetical protein